MNQPDLLFKRILEPIARVIARTGILPEYGSPEYYAYGPAADQPGDVRDCDNEEEYRRYFKVFCGHPPPPSGNK